MNYLNRVSITTMGNHISIFFKFLWIGFMLFAFTTCNSVSSIGLREEIGKTKGTGTVPNVSPMTDDGLLHFKKMNLRLTSAGTDKSRQTVMLLL